MFFKILSIAALVIMSGCGNPSSSRAFDLHYNTVKEVRVNQAFNRDIYYSIFLLEELTGLRSSASYGDISLYQSRADIRHDLRMWKQWLKDNEHHFSIEDSITTVEEEVLNNLDWLQLSE